MQTAILQPIFLFGKAVIWANDHSSVHEVLKALIVLSVTDFVDRENDSCFVSIFIIFVKTEKYQISCFVFGF